MEWMSSQFGSGAIGEEIKRPVKQEERCVEGVHLPCVFLIAAHVTLDSQACLWMCVSCATYILDSQACLWMCVSCATYILDSQDWASHPATVILSVTMICNTADNIVCF